MVTSETPVFGVLLSRYRAAVGLTQEELAERAGLSARGIGDLERGVRSRPRGYTVRRLAEALQLSADDRALLEQAARVAGSIEKKEKRLPEGTFLGAIPKNDLVGRAEERERFRAAIATIADCRGHLLLLGGEVGAGKTRLLQELMLEARGRGFVVLTGHCSLAEQRTAYYPFLEPLSELAARCAPNIRAECERAWNRILRLLSECVLEDA
jgi:transcriptional regulator with XRE-family HTH domain